METSPYDPAILWMSVAMCFGCVSSTGQLPTATLNGRSRTHKAPYSSAKVVVTNQALEFQGCYDRSRGSTRSQTGSRAYNVKADVKGLRRASSGRQLEVGRIQTLVLLWPSEPLEGR